MMTLPILQAFARNRRILLIRRIVAVSFGLVGFALPGLTLVLLYGINCPY